MSQSLLDQVRALIGSHEGPEAARRSQSDCLLPSFLPILRQFDLCFVTASHQGLFLPSGPTFDLPFPKKRFMSVREFL